MCNNDWWDASLHTRCYQLGCWWTWWVFIRRLFTHAMLSTSMLMDLMSVHKTPLYTRDATLLMHLMLMRRLFTLAMLSTWSLDMRITLTHAHTHTRDVWVTHTTCSTWGQSMEQTYLEHFLDIYNVDIYEYVYMNMYIYIYIDIYR